LIGDGAEGGFSRQMKVRAHGFKRVWRGKCASDPQLLAALIRNHAQDAERVAFETGPLSTRYLQYGV